MKKKKKKKTYVVYAQEDGSFSVVSLRQVPLAYDGLTIEQLGSFLEDEDSKVWKKFRSKLN